MPNTAAPLSITDVILYGDVSDLTDAHIERFRDAPELLDMISDRETLRTSRMWWVLVAAAVLVALSKILREFYRDTFEWFVADVAADLVFEMGAALMGSIATVIFLQYRQKRQFEENVRFRAEVRRRIAALEASGA